MPRQLDQCVAGPPGSMTPSQFIGKKVNRYFAVSVLVPCFFFIIKSSDLELVRPAAADSIISILSPLWPVLPQQYDAIRRLGSSRDAANYAVFFAFLLLTSVYFLKYFVCQFIAERRNIVRTSWADLLMVILFGIFSIPVLFFDTPQIVTKPLYNFYVDKFGFYYFRQYMLFVGVYLALLFTAAAAAKVLDRNGSGAT